MAYNGVVKVDIAVKDGVYTVYVETSHKFVFPLLTEQGFKTILRLQATICPVV